MPNQSANKIARKIHDGIAQDLVALGYALDQSLAAPNLHLTTRSELRTIRFQVSTLIEKVRAEILELRISPPSIIESAEEVCGSKLGQIDLQVAVPNYLNSAIVELLRNAVRHSGATVINLISYLADDQLVIEVSDNGSGGFDQKQIGFGLIGVTETITELAGEINFIEIKPGLLIRLSIPQ